MTSAWLAAAMSAGSNLRNAFRLAETALLYPYLLNVWHLAHDTVKNCQNKIRVGGHQFALFFH